MTQQPPAGYRRRQAIPAPPATTAAGRLPPLREPIRLRRAVTRRLPGAIRLRRGSYPPPGNYPPPQGNYPPPGYPVPGAPAFGAPAYSVGEAVSWAWNKFSTNAAAILVPTLVFGVIYGDVCRAAIQAISNRFRHRRQLVLR